MTETKLTFAPDWVSPPGETIEDLLLERNWTHLQLAEHLGYTPTHVMELIQGKAAISEETAIKLEQVLGSSAAFWLKREAQYRSNLAYINDTAIQGKLGHPTV